MLMKHQSISEFQLFIHKKMLWHRI